MQAFIKQPMDFSFAPLQNVSRGAEDFAASKKDDSVKSEKKSFEQLVSDAKKTSETDSPDRSSVQNQAEEDSGSKKTSDVDENVLQGKSGGMDSAERVDGKSRKNSVSEEVRSRKTTKDAVKVADARNSEKKVAENLEKQSEKTIPDLKKNCESEENLNVAVDLESSSEKSAAQKKTFAEENSSGSEIYASAAFQFVEGEGARIQKNSALSDGDEKIVSEGKSARKTFRLDADGKITVDDQRTETRDSAKKQARLEPGEVRFDGKNRLEMDMELSARGAGANILSSDSQSASSVDSNFKAMLNNQIQQNAENLVRAGNIVLKDNDVGEIKLILHPESLGNVKIDLHLKDNSITGRIMVQSQEAFEAFKESAESLKRAFVSGGFESASFDLAFTGRGGANDGGSHGNERRNVFYMERAYQGRLDGDVLQDGGDFSSEVYTNNGANSVNIVA